MMDDDVIVQMPTFMTPEMIEAVRSSPLCAVEDQDQWYIRLGWLICAYEAMVKSCLPPPTKEQAT